MLRRETKMKLSFDKPREYKSVTLIGSEVKEKEIDPVAKVYKHIGIEESIPYNISLDIKIDDTFVKKSLSNQLLSYIISVDFDSLANELQDQIRSWIKTNFKAAKDGIYTMQQSVIALTYSSNFWKINSSNAV